MQRRQVFARSYMDTPVKSRSQNRTWGGVPLTTQEMKRAARRLDKKRTTLGHARPAALRNAYEMERDLWRLAEGSGPKLLNTTSASTSAVTHADDLGPTWLSNCDFTAGDEVIDNTSQSKAANVGHRVTTIYRPEEREALCTNWSTLLPRLRAPYEAFRSGLRQCRPCPPGCNDDECAQTRRRHRVIMVSFLGE